MRALEALDVGRDRRILDVGIGPGSFFLEIRRRAGPGAFVCGIDLSRGMVRRARQRARRTGRDAPLFEADALALPFRADTFDVVLSSYVLDLMSEDDITAALDQFHRVLVPGGRLVLVNLSKPDPDRFTWYERCYRALPTAAQAYVLGGCRPVCLIEAVNAARFVEMHRTLVRQGLPSEIVVAEKGLRESEWGRAA
jgi:ubiquinone/menaquinone biosynthesis C-methylase UbiE